MDPIGTLLERPRQYGNIDGLSELGGSVMCLGLALIWWLLMRTPADAVWHRLSFFAFIALMLLIHYGVKAIKTRITYPRTGFVEYRKQWRTSVISAVVAVLAVGLAVAFRRRSNTSVVALLLGFAFAASYGYHLAKAVRWKWVVAGAIAAAAFVIPVLPADFLRTLGSELPPHPGRAELLGTILLSLLVYGALLLISGGISLWLYLRNTQAPAQDGQ